MLRRGLGDEASGTRVTVLTVVVALVVGAIWLPAEVPAEAREARIGAVVAPLSLVPNSQAPLTIPAQHSYFGRIKLESFGDGMVVVNRLSLERYLLGLAEVPTDWPTEAQRAQSVAARTYALWTLNRPPAGAAASYGFDICASVQCQAFAGADVVSGETGFRWAQAVADTAGQVLVYAGQPILARYHSTSGGRTLDNADVFTTEPNYPYLQSVPSPTEAASPLFRWRVEFPMRVLQRILEQEGSWTARQGRLERGKTVRSSRGFHYPDVILRGTKGAIRLTAEDFRTRIRELAPAMFSNRYPSSAPTTSGFLPETLPSNRIRITTIRKTIVVIGRGWGHGVGMSQWGAHGLALRGASYPAILAHYYRGAELTQLDTERPIDVGVNWGQSRVAVTGSFRIVDGRGKTIVRRALGTWGFDWVGEGAIGIDPPRGYGLPLEIGIVDAPERIAIGESTFLTVALSRPAEVTTITSSGEGLDEPDTLVKEAGRRRIPWFAPVEPGVYSVRVRASTGSTVKRSEPIQIAVFEPSGEDESEGLDAGGFPLWLVLAAGALILVTTWIARVLSRIGG